MGQGQAQPPAPRPRLTPEEKERYLREWRKKEGLDQPEGKGLMYAIEDFGMQPAVQIPLIAGSLGLGTVPGAIAGGAEAFLGGVSTINRMSEGDDLGAILSAIGTALGGQALVRGGRDIGRINRIKELAAAEQLGPMEVKLLRESQNLDPSMWSPEVRRIINMIRGTPSPMGANRAAVQQSAQDVKDRLAAWRAANPQAGTGQTGAAPAATGATGTTTGATSTSTRVPPVINRPGRPSTATGTGVPPAAGTRWGGGGTNNTPAAGTPAAGTRGSTGGTPAAGTPRAGTRPPTRPSGGGGAAAAPVEPWKVGARRLESLDGDVFWEQPGGRLFTDDGVEITRRAPGGDTGGVDTSGGGTGGGGGGTPAGPRRPRPRRPGPQTPPTGVGTPGGAPVPPAAGGRMSIDEIYDRLRKSIEADAAPSPPTTGRTPAAGTPAAPAATSAPALTPTTNVGNDLLRSRLAQIDEEIAKLQGKKTKGAINRLNTLKRQRAALQKKLVPDSKVESFLDETADELQAEHGAVVGGDTSPALAGRTAELAKRKLRLDEVKKEISTLEKQLGDRTGKKVNRKALQNRLNTLRAEFQDLSTDIEVKKRGVVPNRPKKEPPKGGEPPAAPAVPAGVSEAEDRARYGLPPKRKVTLYRAMEPDEYEEWQRTGIIKSGVQERATTERANAEFWVSRRKPGTRVVEFEADIDDLQTGNNQKGNYRITKDIQTHQPGRGSDGPLTEESLSLDPQAGDWAPRPHTEALLDADLSLQQSKLRDGIAAMEAVFDRLKPKLTPLSRRQWVRAIDQSKERLARITRLLDGSTPNDPAVDAIERAIARAKAETGLPPTVAPLADDVPPVAAEAIEPEVAAAAAGGVPPLNTVNDLRRRVLEDLVRQREELLKGLPKIDDAPQGFKDEIKRKIAALDEQIANRIADLDKAPPPPRVPGTPPPAIGTREERIEQIRQGFGKPAGEAPAPPPAAPVEPPAPGLGAVPEQNLEPLPAGAEPPPAAATPAPVVPTPAPVKPTPLDPPTQNFIGLRTRISMLRTKLAAAEEKARKANTPGNLMDLDVAKKDLKVAEERLARLREMPSVKEFLEKEKAGVQVPGAPEVKPPKKTRKTNKSLTPEEAAAAEAQRKADAAEGREPWRGVRKPEKPTREQVLAEREAAEKARIAENARILKEAGDRIRKQGQSDTNHTAGRLRTTGSVLKRIGTQHSPGSSEVLDKFKDAINKWADEVEKGGPDPRPFPRGKGGKTPKGPRLIGKDGKPIFPKKKLGDESDELGASVTELLSRVSGMGIGGLAGFAYGANQEPVEGDTTGNKVMGAAGGALLGFLGSAAGMRKLQGGKLSKMAQRYQFFSLLSDPTVLGRATLGAYNSILTMATQRILEKRYGDAANILKTFLGDTAGLRWFRVLGSRDQSVHLPPTLRNRFRQGARATNAPGYAVQDLPGRVISAGDIVSTRAGHAGGFSLDEIQRLNIGGNPQFKWARNLLNSLGEDVHYTEVNAQGQRVRKTQRSLAGRRQKALMRTIVPFARMAVALPERTIAFMPGVNEITGVRRALGMSKQTARARGIIGAGALGAGYAGADYFSPDTDPWLTAMAGPTAGLAQIGLGAKRMMQGGQGGFPFLHQQVQNLVPGISEQFSFPGLANRVIPGVATFVAKSIDPAARRATGPDTLKEARYREGRGDIGLDDITIGMGETIAANLKSRLPYLSQTNPEIYRGRTKFGHDISPERRTGLNPFAFNITRDSTMRGNIGGYQVVLPKMFAGTPHASLSKYEPNDEISQRIRTLEAQTGIPIMGTPSQPLQDALFTEIAQAQGVPPERIHRDIKAGIEKVRGMAPRMALQQILSPSFQNMPVNRQAIVIKDIVDKMRGSVNKAIEEIPRASLADPRGRQQFVATLDALAKQLSGGWK